jgi:hypothetical protein
LRSVPSDRPTIQVAIVVAIAITFAACSTAGTQASKGTSASTTALPASTTSTAAAHSTTTTSTTVVSTTVVSTTTSMPGSSGTPDLEAMLLAIADMPTGWNAKSTSSAAGSGLCSIPDLATDASAKAEAAYGGPIGLPLWAELLAIPRAGTSSSIFTSDVSLMNGCHSFTEKASNGQSTTFTVSPLSLKKVGDESGAWTVTETSFEIPYTGDVVFARFGSIIAEFSYGNVEPDMSQFESLANRAAAKISVAT